MKHTKLPWEREETNTKMIFQEGTYPYRYICDCGFDISQQEEEANAEFIVRACNSHYDLLEALKFAKSVIQSGERWTETCEKMIDARIAKAEGKD